jgi:hypothetical protein
MSVRGENPKNDRSFLKFHCVSGVYLYSFGLHYRFEAKSGELEEQDSAENDERLQPPLCNYSN